jgi:heat shock protein HslJ
MNTKFLFLLLLGVALLAACGNQEKDSSQDQSAASITGEFWLNADQLMFAECGSGLTVPVSGAGVEEMKKALLDNQIADGNRLYAEVQGEIVSSEKGRSLEAASLITADKTKSCLRGNSENAEGTYSASLSSASSAGREIILELAPDSVALLSTDYLNGQPVALQTGKWNAIAGDKVIVSFSGKMGETFDLEFVCTWNNDLTFSGDSFGSDGLYMEKQGPSRLQLIREALYSEMAQLAETEGKTATAEQLSPSTEISQVITGDKAWNSLLAFIAWNLTIEKDERNSLRSRFKTVGDVENYIHNALVQSNVILKKIYVSPKPGNCANLDSNQCIEIRPSQSGWETIDVPIDNFAFEPGSLYDITISETKKSASPDGKASTKRSLFRQNKTFQIQTDYKLHDKWGLVELNGKAVGAMAFKESPFIEFNLTENKVSGHTGCNRLFGDLTIAKDSLNFASLATTKMMCPETSEFETSLVETLQKVTAFRIKDFNLELLSGGNVVIRFRKSE